MAYVEKIVVRKDGFIPSKPWCADVHWENGEVWRSWCYGYRTKKAILRHIRAVNNDAIIFTHGNPDIAIG